MGLRVLGAALLGAAVLGLADPAGAQIVMGRVVDSVSRRPLPNVTVRLLRVASVAVPASGAVDGGAGDVVDSAFTVKDGAFVLNAPRAGSYRVSISSSFEGPPVLLADAEAVHAREYVIGIPPTTVFHESQVDKPVGLKSGLRTRYPKELQAQRIEGRLVAEFVVDTAGRAEPNTFRAVGAARNVFVALAQEAILAAEFTPAEFGRRKVRQLARLPMSWSVER